MAFHSRIYEVLRLAVRHLGRTPVKKKNNNNFAANSYANDFANAKSHAGKKPLLAG